MSGANKNTAGAILLRNFDKETGTYYLRARCYDPAIGRFTSADSFAGVDNDPLSLNLYTYAHNNPVLMSDPSGHFAWITAAIGAVVSVAAVYVTDVVQNSIKNGGFSIECLKPTSSVGTYLSAGITGGLAGFTVAGLTGVAANAAKTAIIAADAIGGSAIKHVVDDAIVPAFDGDSNTASGFDADTFIKDTGLNFLGGRVGAFASRGLRYTFEPMFPNFSEMSNTAFKRVAGKGQRSLNPFKRFIFGNEPLHRLSKEGVQRNYDFVTEQMSGEVSESIFDKILSGNQKSTFDSMTPCTIGPAPYKGPTITKLEQ